MTVPPPRRGGMDTGGGGGKVCVFSVKGCLLITLGLAMGGAEYQLVALASNQDNQ